MSYDDASLANIVEAFELGRMVTDFPTTFEAATAASTDGLQVLMDAPNLFRGGPHLAAGGLASFGHLDLMTA